MTKYINTSGHSGPEWILSNFGIGEHLREVLGDAGMEVFGITFTHSNVPTTAEVSTPDGIVRIPFKDLDAEKSDQLIREFFPSEKFVEQVEEAVEDISNVLDEDFDSKETPVGTGGPVRPTETVLVGEGPGPELILPEELPTPKGKKR